MDPILVTGGTGTLGRHVVRRLLEAGRDVRVLTRQTRRDDSRVQFITGDLLSGSEIGPAVEGVPIVVHCAGSSRGDEIGTQKLVNAASSARRPYIVYVSVVGADRIPVTGPFDRMMLSYFDMKLKAERIVADSGLPWTTLRATQFYDLMFTVVKAMTKLPIVPVPSGIAFQPVDADEVAARLVALALGPASGLVPDIAGPRVYRMADLLRSYLTTAHRHRLLVPVHLPGRGARALRAGANLARDRAVGTRTWEDFLTNHVAPPRAA